MNSKDNVTIGTIIKTVVIVNVGMLFLIGLSFII